MELDFLETFALAEDREAVLERLIPGTEDYYFYRCLQHQHAGRLGEVPGLLRVWIERHGRTSQVQEIERRQTLLGWEADPEGTGRRVASELGLRFDHQRQVEGESAGHPTVMPRGLLERRRLLARALSHHPHDLGGVTDRALTWLVGEDLDVDRKRQLLDRLPRPDLPGVVDLVLEELRDERSRGFGSLRVHRLLLADQLEELRERAPDLLTSEAFVHACLVRLQPGPDEAWEHDPARREAYLERLWAFVSDLPPSFNSLKAHVLYHRLEDDRRQARYDRERFQAYVALPRQSSTAEPEHLRRHRDHLARLDQDFRPATLLPPVSDDAPLLRDYLAHFFREADDFRLPLGPRSLFGLGAPTGERLDAYLREPLLREVFAETKILAGAGDMERWVSILDDPVRYQALRERVDVELAPTNPEVVRPGQAVALEADVKNVPTLVLKVFEVNAFNYLHSQGTEPDTALDLDGLVATVERTYTHEEPPHRRVRRTFELPEVARPGLYVVELLGNGKSSRALIRVGDLRFLERTGAAGHELVVLDQDGSVLPDATVWLGGREYRPDEAGRIRLPFTARPGRTPLILRHGELAVLDHLQHQAESFALEAGIHVEREALVAGREADVVIRPALKVAGQPASLALLEEPRLTVEAVDRQGARSTRTYADVDLSAERELVVRCKVPEDLAELHVTLRARVRSAVTGATEDLQADRSFPVNGVDASDQVACLHLSRSEEGYALHLLGKTGEPRAGRGVHVELRHHDFTRPVAVQLQTDAAGRVALGHLPGIESLSARSDALHEAWVLGGGDRVDLPPALQGRAGEPLYLAYAGAATDRDRSVFALLERRGEGYLRDRLDALRVADGCLVLEGLAPGDYDLRLEELGATVRVAVAAGREEGAWVVGERRLLERRGRRPLALAEAAVDAEGLRLRVAHATPATRVHVVATRYVAPWSLGESLGRHPAGPRAVELTAALSHYVSGRDIGDEYRYVLERRYAPRRPGVLLARPGLLLNPWAVRKTETSHQEAGEGGEYARQGAARRRAPVGAAAMAPEPALPAGGFATLDFLADPAVVLTDLRPDPQGRVRVPREALGDARLATVVAVDGAGVASRAVPLADGEVAARDRRLLHGVDPAATYAQRKRTSCLRAGDELVVKDITTSKLEVYDTLERVYGLFQALSGDDHLETFRFVTRWPRLDEAEKRRLYGEHACHELHLFLARKDPAFFAGVVRPYLRNKKDKTFLDRYLLGDDLAAYLRPWAYGRLNVVERTLLAQRIDGEGPRTARHVGDGFDLLPPDPEREDHLFRTALGGSALETSDGLGLSEARKEALSVMTLAGAAPPAAAPLRAMSRMAKKAPPPPAPKAVAMDAFGAAESEEAAFDFDDLARDADARREIRQLYRRAERTQEYAESNYWRLRTDEVGPDLVTVNGFWRDYARHDGRGPFVSPHLAEASRNFTEMMCALAVLDLPFSADGPETRYAGPELRLRTRAEAVVFHEELEPAEPAAEAAPVLVSQVYLRDDDRHRHVGGEVEERYVEGELLTGVVYACKVVLTNPTASRRKLDLLLQIPRGSLPVRGGAPTRSLRVQLGPYETRDLEYAFYFPFPGAFPHLPVQASRDGELLASAPAATLEVLERPRRQDTGSWAWVSQHAEPEAVLAFLERENVEGLDLSLVAWRLRERGFYEQLTALLARRHRYDDTVWSYALLHADPAGAREYLHHQERWLRGAGLALEAPLLTVDPVARGWHEHLEYAPFINARAHRLGARRRVLNDRLAAQYGRFLQVLARRPGLGPEERLGAAYYLLLQDRIEEGLERLARVDEADVEERLQLDYLRAYAAFLQGRPEEARALAERHADHPVPRWAGLFQTVLAHLAEAAGTAAQVAQELDPAQRQQEAAAREPALDLSTAGGAVTVHYRNLGSCQVDVYRMDVELLFSRQPFVQDQTERFSFIRPNHSQPLDLPPDRDEVTVELPAELGGANLVVEVTADGIRRSVTVTASALRVVAVETMGEVRVTRRGDARPLPAAYVKVYARMQGGEVRFYKDGYTDLRGRFDYASLSTDELDGVERFALLVLEDEHGAVVREAAPPRR